MAWYFRHDYSARNDRKITELEMEMGENIGYAMWFKMLEIMGEMGGSLSKDKLKVAAYSMRVPLDLLMQFIRICVRIELLDENGDEYVNARFAEECARIKETSQKASNSARIKWEKEKMLKPKTKKKTDTATPESEEVDAMIESIEKEIGAHPISNLSNAEKSKLKAKYGDALPKMLRNYYLWKVSKNKKVKSDYLSILKPWVEESVKSKFGTNASAAKQMSRIEQINNVTDFIGKEMT